MTGSGQSRAALGVARSIRVRLRRTIVAELRDIDGLSLDVMSCGEVRNAPPKALVMWPDNRPVPQSVGVMLMPRA